MNYLNVTPLSAYSLLVTENCNLACKYCYEENSSGHKNKNMSIETAKQLLIYSFTESKKHNKKVDYSFFGGEPTLNIDIIDYLCTQGKLLSKKYNISFSVNIITNATIMNKKIYNIFKKHSDVFTNCQLSIDGHQIVQDLNRITKNGKGSFNTIEKNIPYWKELFKDKLNIHGVLNHNTISELYNSYLFFREKWNVPMLWFLPAKDKKFTKNHVEIYDHEMNKIYNYIMERVRKDNSIFEIEAYAPLNRSLKNGGSSKPCGIGDNYCAVTAEGDIFPCHHLYFIDTKRETLLGNIWNGIDKAKKLMWTVYDNSDIIGCQGCDHPYCYRCPAENYEKYGTPFVQIKDLHCDFMKVDLKYQRLIKNEIQQMGLLNRGNKQC